MRKSVSAAVLAALAVGGCGQEPASPWLTAPDRLRHAVYFAIDTGAHAGVDCGSCHGAFDTFARFDCLSCHAKPECDPIHVAIAGYAHESARCYGCHRSGDSIDPQAHAAYFPIAAGTDHAGAACASCHVDPADRKAIGCTSCHGATPMATAHGLVGGYSASRCTACHAEGQVDRLAAHLPFVITAGEHARRSCFACHPAMRADKPWAVSFAGVDCLGCHGRASTDAEHAGRSGYTWTTSACLRCHPSGRGD